MSPWGGPLDLALTFRPSSLRLGTRRCLAGGLERSPWLCVCALWCWSIAVPDGGEEDFPVSGAEGLPSSGARERGLPGERVTIVPLRLLPELVAPYGAFDASVLGHPAHNPLVFLCSVAHTMSRGGLSRWCVVAHHSTRCLWVVPHHSTRLLRVGGVQALPMLAQCRERSRVVLVPRAKLSNERLLALFPELVATHCGVAVPIQLHPVVQPCVLIQSELSRLLLRRSRLDGWAGR
mmetsp:Transcript_51179/g.111278  ORF Transcript_51179/g.111278 Transcript_51179/m.111278 type:complete len:235 (-) Transcript_51179:344-1048(-)